MGLFEEEMTSYTDELRAQAIRFCKNEADALDLLQDTFHKALLYKDSFTMGTNLRAWLYRIMKNTFINGYRRNQRFNAYVEKEKQIKEGSSTYTDGSETLISRQELKDLLDELEECLDECFFTVLVLVDVHDKSYKETAEILDVPIGTVMSRLYRARKKSKQYLIQNYDDELLEEVLHEETLEELEFVA
jgi:RNA polymerase sigma-70 factor (ECF subfamily)